MKSRHLGVLAILLASCHAAPNGALLHHRAENALGPYSAAVEAGSLVFVSGKIGEQVDAFAREAETAMEAVGAELARRNLSFSDVVAATVYLTDMKRYAEFNEIYARYFTKPFYPARACVAVAALPRAARVEVQVTAYRRKKD